VIKGTTKDAGSLKKYFVPIVFLPLLHSKTTFNNEKYVLPISTWQLLNTAHLYVKN